MPQHPEGSKLFTVMDMAMEGELLKQGSSWMKTWKKRYFILRQDTHPAVLAYYERSETDRSNLRLLGEIHLVNRDQTGYICASFWHFDQAIREGQEQITDAVLRKYRPGEGASDLRSSTADAALGDSPPLSENVSPLSRCFGARCADTGRDLLMQASNRQERDAWLDKLRHVTQQSLKAFQRRDSQQDSASNAQLQARRGSNAARTSPASPAAVATPEPEDDFDAILRPVKSKIKSSRSGKRRPNRTDERPGGDEAGGGSGLRHREPGGRSTHRHPDRLSYDQSVESSMQQISSPNEMGLGISVSLSNVVDVMEGIFVTMHLPVTPAPANPRSRDPSDTARDFSYDVARFDPEAFACTDAIKGGDAGSELHTSARQQTADSRADKQASASGASNGSGSGSSMRRNKQGTEEQLVQRQFTVLPNLEGNLFHQIGLDRLEVMFKVYKQRGKSSSLEQHELLAIGTCYAKRLLGLTQPLDLDLKINNEYIDDLAEAALVKIQSPSGKLGVSLVTSEAIQEKEISRLQGFSEPFAEQHFRFFTLNEQKTKVRVETHISTFSVAVPIALVQLAVAERYPAIDRKLSSVQERRRDMLAQTKKVEQEIEEQDPDGTIRDMLQTEDAVNAIGVLGVDEINPNHTKSAEHILRMQSEMAKLRAKEDKYRRTEEELMELLHGCVAYTNEMVALYNSILNVRDSGDNGPAPGAEVEVKVLDRPELNGLRGTVMRHIACTDLWEVELNDDQKTRVQLKAVDLGFDAMGMGLCEEECKPVTENSAWLKSPPGDKYVLKRSTLKKSKRLRFVPTNLNVEVVHAEDPRVSPHNSASNGSERDNSFPFHTTNEQVKTFSSVTFGCTAAHHLKFDRGGMRRLIGSDPSERRLWCVVSPVRLTKPPVVQGPLWISARSCAYHLTHHSTIAAFTCPLCPCAGIRIPGARLALRNSWNRTRTPFGSTASGSSIGQMSLTFPMVELILLCQDCPTTRLPRVSTPLRPHFSLRRRRELLA